MRATSRYRIVQAVSKRLKLPVHDGYYEKEVVLEEKDKTWMA